jgi:iron-sulfur cluster assembly accessory protein
MSAAGRAARAALQISPEAAARLRALVSAAPPPRPAGVRVGLRTRGCNGMSYVMDYAAAPREFDERVDLPDGGAGAGGEDPRLQVFVDPRALLHIVGTRMHFVDNDLVSEFVFENPNAKGHCGCGESFNV